MTSLAQRHLASEIPTDRRSSVDPKEPDERSEAAQRDPEPVEQGTPRIRLLNTPPHRNLDGERGGELAEDPEAGEKPDET
jgi:hypothetical protein